MFPILYLVSIELYSRHVHCRSSMPIPEMMPDMSALLEVMYGLSNHVTSDDLHLQDRSPTSSLDKCNFFEQ